MPQPEERRGRRAARHNREIHPPKPRGQRWAVVRETTAFDFGTFYGLDAYVRPHGDKWAVFHYANEDGGTWPPIYIRDSPAAAMAAWDQHVQELRDAEHPEEEPASTDRQEPPRPAA